MFIYIYVNVFSSKRQRKRERGGAKTGRQIKHKKKGERNRSFILTREEKQEGD